MREDKPRTLATLAKVLERARELKLPILLISTTGETAKILLELMGSVRVPLTVVTYPPILAAPREFDPQVRRQLLEAGARVIVYNPVIPFPLSWIRWVSETFGITSLTRRDRMLEEKFGAGGKVCIKAAEEYFRRGDLTGRPYIQVGEMVVAVAGKESGADTGLVLRCQSAQPVRIEVVEIIVRA